jgi:hypothetical protein
MIVRSIQSRRSEFSIAQWPLFFLTPTNSQEVRALEMTVRDTPAMFAAFAGERAMER